MSQLSMKTNSLRVFEDPWDWYAKVMNVESYGNVFTSLGQRPDCSCCGYEVMHYTCDFNIDNVPFDYDTDKFGDVQFGCRLTIRRLMIVAEDDHTNTTGIESNDIIDVIDFDSIDRCIEYFGSENNKIVFDRFSKNASFKKFWDDLNFLSSVIV